MKITTTRRIVAAIAVAAAVLAVAPATAGAKAKGKKLVGTFSVTAGASSGTSVTGSYFRMVQSGGTPAAGPYLPNTDSAATDKTYTLLTQGTDGLVTSKFQPQPEPPFDASGNGVATAIVTPTTFFGVKFALATNKKDPQLGAATKAPSITVKGGKLSGDLDAVGVAYGKQHFNQGSPKPDGSKPDGTAGPTGTYDAKTKKYTLEWSSAIVGGPFNGFTGIWHLEGSFKPAK